MFQSHVIDAVNKSQSIKALKAQKLVREWKGRDVDIYRERTEEHKRNINDMAGIEGQMIKELQQTTEKNRQLTDMINNRNSRRISINLAPQLNNP